MRKKLGPILAWTVTIGILVYLFHTIPLAKVGEAIHAAYWWAIPATALIVLAVYLADSYAIMKTFGWFVAPLSYREVLVVRGATYLLALVNYTIGQGAIIYFVNRSRGVPILRGTAAVLLVMGVNVLMLLVLSSVGLLVASDVPPVLRLVVLIAYASLAVYVVLVMLRPSWLARRPLFDVLLSAGVGGHLRAMAVRVPHIFTLLALSWVSMAAFGVVIPVAKAILCLPIVYFVAVLPISVQGLGTSQALMIHFFSEYAPGATTEARWAAVLAAGLVAQAVAFVIQLSIGLGCMRSQLAHDLAQPGGAAAMEEAP
ncbi:MAG: flippase-like domain-containing protein [Deltaproteobacteria bacterium]|nr:flippase-like domain-containing protein [Deltaproteobacteria bacterium]